MGGLSFGRQRLLTTLAHRIETPPRLHGGLVWQVPGPLLTNALLPATGRGIIKGDMAFLLLVLTSEGAAYMTAAAGLLTALAALLRARAEGTRADRLEFQVHDHEARIRVLEARG